MEKYAFCQDVVFDGDCSNKLIDFLKRNNFFNIVAVCPKQIIEMDSLVKYLSIIEENKINLLTLTTIENGKSDSDKVDDAINFIKGNKVDCIVCFGFEKSLNRAKLLSLKLSNPDFDAEICNKTQKKGLPLITFPLSAYTTNFANCNIMLYDFASKSGHMVFDENCMPVFSFVDINLIIDMQRYFSHVDCLDVLINLIESYLGRKCNYISLFLSLNGLSLFFNFVEKYIDDAQNKEALSKVLLATYISNIVSNECNLGLISAFTRNYSSSTNLSYHHTLIKYFESLMNFNKIKSNKKLVDMAVCLKIETNGLTQNQIIEKVIARIFNFVNKFSLVKQKEENVDEDNINLICENIFDDSCVKNNVRETSLDDIQYLIKNKKVN